MVKDLYPEGFVDYGGLNPVAGLQVLLPLAVLMEDFALEGFVLEGFTEKVPLPYFGLFFL